MGLEMQKISFDKTITLWDYYAAHALSGFLAALPKDAIYRSSLKKTDLATIIGSISDAMLLEREKRGIK